MRVVSVGEFVQLDRNERLGAEHGQSETTGRP